MQWIRNALLLFALCFSMNVSAMTDAEEETFREALQGGDIKTLEGFVKENPDVVNRKIFGWSPLQMATHANQEKVVNYFIDKGADLNYIHPTAYHTAFHLAVFENNKKLATLLAEKGADINILLRNDVSLIEHFRVEGNQDMVDFLLKLGVKETDCKISCD